MMTWAIGDRVRGKDQPDITGEGVRHDCGGKVVVLDDDRDDWTTEGEEGTLVFRPEELTKEDE